MHYVTSKSLLSAKNGMNLYRGCTHGCIYCDSRSDIYNMGHSFEDIEVKENALELLKKELIKRPKSMIGTGSMTDPYVPLEKNLEYVRKSLELIYRYGFGFTCITKSDLILRDLDLLKKINEKSKVVVQMTITTADDGLCRILEPNVCPTSRRVEVLKRFDEADIPTVVWLSPILPHINDDEENISRILDYCIETNVYGIICFGMGMTLRQGNREYFYERLDESFPGLKDEYIRRYGDSYSISSPNNDKLMRIFQKRTEENGILNNHNEIFDYLHDFPQDSVQSTLM
ncbi:radical SAM protein [Methanobrevibacter sp. YE315]|uniref:SPL family radical SAM protein n=1 Tax=Methanobrevibacter sp. YE315 TaxID=1609968 RepID=UPI000764E45C|nr:radical SAM protein [Methanobrevibacter sp. YE315]AMD17774.1 radical SAM protein [Methanobrevibacter sp. YE315]